MSDVVTFKGGEIDLSGELRDELVLAVPFNPLCDEGVSRPLLRCAAATATSCRALRAEPRTSDRARRARRAGQDQAPTIPPRQ